MTGEYPKYCTLWVHYPRWSPSAEGRPRHRGRVRSARAAAGIAGRPGEPLRLTSKRQYEVWESDQEGRENGRTPPVFIVALQQHQRQQVAVRLRRRPRDRSDGIPDGAAIVAPGHFPIFSNVADQHWLHRPNSILVDSEQLESDEGMSPEFKKLARGAQIEEFKAEFRKRFPDRDTSELLTDEDLMREVLNTVGKPGKLGENVKCVVSVSMLTEGWDAHTVTHILGVRAFGTQLLCEQVVGLRGQAPELRHQRQGALRPGIRRRVRCAVLLHPLRRRAEGGRGEEADKAGPSARGAGAPDRAALAGSDLPARSRIPLRGAGRTTCGGLR